MAAEELVDKSPGESPKPSGQREEDYQRVLGLTKDGSQLSAADALMLRALMSRTLDYDPEKEKARLKNQNLGATIGLRIGWSIIAAAALFHMLRHQACLAHLIGKGDYDFTKYQWYLNLTVGENFVQIVGLCTIIITALYPRQTPDPTE